MTSNVHIELEIVLHGGAAIMEHPSEPVDENYMRVCGGPRFNEFFVDEHPAFSSCPFNNGASDRQR